MLHDPGAEHPRRRRTGRGVRPHGRRRGHRAERPAHPRRPHSSTPGDVDERPRRDVRGQDRADRARPRRASWAASSINLPSHWKRMGRSREAVAAAEHGHRDLATAHGLLDTEAWVRANLAESLFSLGRWDEAAEAAVDARRSGRPAPQGARPRRHRAAPSWPSPAVTSPRPRRQLAAARAHFGTHDPQPQHRIAAGPPRDGHRRAAGPPPRRPRPHCEARRTAASRPAPSATRWPLLLVAATAEADARGLPAAEPGRAGDPGPHPQAPPSAWPRSSRSGSPTDCGPRRAAARRGPRHPRRLVRVRSPPSSPWTAPTTWPGSATARPKPSSRLRRPADGHQRSARRNCSADGPAPPPTGPRARRPLARRPSRCSPSAPASP